MNLGEEEAKGMKGKVELRGWRPRKRSQPVFSFGRPERCRATREKREELEGSREVGGRSSLCVFFRG